MFRSRWILANAIGFALGSVLGGGLAGLLEQPYVGITSAGAGALVLAIDAGVSLGAFGAVVGLTQWLFLRRRVARAAWWAPATAAGWAAAGIVAGGLAGAIGGAVTDVGGDLGTWGFAVAAIAGVAAIAFLPGALQALVLGRGPRWRTLACLGLAAGWAVGAPAILFAGNVLHLGLPSAGAWVMGGLPMGLVNGAITGGRLGRWIQAAAGRANAAGTD